MTLRLEPEVIEKLDRLVERRYQQEGLNVTRVDLIRQAIRQYVERETAEVG
jgi:predicted transcriptional regulator